MAHLMDAVNVLAQAGGLAGVVLVMRAVHRSATPEAK